MIRFVLLLLLTFLAFSVNAANDSKLDSLKMELTVATEDTLKARILSDIVSQYMENDTDSAEIYSDQAIKLLESISPSIYLAKAYSARGTLLIHKGYYFQAVDYLMKSLQLFEELGHDKYQIAATRNNIGVVYERVKDFESAADYFSTAVEVAEQVEDDKRRGVILCNLYLNLGSSSDGIGKKEDALHYFQKARQLAEKHDQKLVKAKALNNLGNFYAKEGETEEAFKYHSEALKLKRELMDYSSLPSSMFAVANYHIEHGEFAIAEKYLEEALDFATKYNSVYNLREAHQFLFELYNHMGNLEKALEHHILFKQYTDEIRGDENSKKINNLIQKYEFEKLQREAEKRQQAKEQRIYAGAVLAALLILIIYFLYMLQRSKTKAALLEMQRSELEQAQLQLSNNNLEQQLSFKNKELTTNVMHLLQKNELINKVSEELMTAQRNMKRDNQKLVRQVVFELQSASNEEMWKEFEMHFQQVHSGFYESLNEKYPDLTPNERKLCAFLRLNMSTKDISAITHQSPKSIDMARFRLRKKLNLNGADQDLYTFVATI
ncbi:tetratricopeptide repeat protein [Limibacter armeniacum]|uniref:tetratricopeptide repeat protein n=1 Tax=Limibacter armeniacum TaxID=466084 RepID=UPI002FE6B4A6